MRSMKTAVLLLAVAFTCTQCGGGGKKECGNNKVEGLEECDGTDLDGSNCNTFGFLGGNLGCHGPGSDVACTYNLSTCTGGCGNNRAEGLSDGLTVEEACDGLDLRGNNCEVVGFELGTVACLADCSGFDESGCYDPTCGDGSIEGSEDCEPDVPLGDTCVTLGFSEGDLACAGCRYDTSGCITWECGNGVLEGTEQCDTDIFREDETCVSLGHDAGTLLCYGPETDTPCRYNEEECTDWVCGDDTVEGDENCEPGVTFTEQCTDLGFLSGTLGCHAAGDADECLWDFSACVGGCGNDVIEGIAEGLTADEVCDGTDLDGMTCETLPGSSFSGGELACQPTCDDWDTTGCIT